MYNQAHYTNYPYFSPKPTPKVFEAAESDFDLKNSQFLAWRHPTTIEFLPIFFDRLLDLLPRIGKEIR